MGKFLNNEAKIRMMKEGVDEKELFDYMMGKFCDPNLDNKEYFDAISKKKAELSRVEEEITWESLTDKDIKRLISSIHNLRPGILSEPDEFRQFFNDFADEYRRRGKSFYDFYLDVSSGKVQEEQKKSRHVLKPDAQEEHGRTTYGSTPAVKPS